MSGIFNYLTSSTVEERRGNGDVFVKVYNNTGTSIADRAIKMLVPIWITGKGTVIVPIAAATNAAKTSVIGVCEGTHADKTYVFYQIQGFCPNVTTGTVTANDYVQVINSGTPFIDEGGNGGTQPTADAVGITVTVNTATNADIYIFGNPCTIAGS